MLALHGCRVLHMHPDEKGYMHGAHISWVRFQPYASGFYRHSIGETRGQIPREVPFQGAVTPAELRYHAANTQHHYAHAV